MKKLHSVFLVTSFLIGSSSFGQSFLETPIEGVYGDDFIIVNYVDWDTAGIKDANCGTKTYDGHQGTDFTIRSFRQMDSGVNVLAAADGVITYIKDGEFDRETEGDVSKKLGNYIAIKHPNDYYTYYGHLKKNSLLVDVGDSVKSGQIIGEVGSSGNSTDPHLHFEVWYDSLFVVDPFTGACGNATSLFNTPLSYDTSFHVWEYGLSHKTGITINDLRNRYTSDEVPYSFRPSVDSSLVFWGHMYGLRAGKELTVNWLTPNNNVWYTYSYTLASDYWFYYYWTFINHQDLEEGNWNVQVLYDNQEIIKQPFTISASSSILNPKEQRLCSKEVNVQTVWSESKKVTAFNQYGQEVTSLFHPLKNSSPQVIPGVYILHIETSEGNQCILKTVIAN